METEFEAKFYPVIKDKFRKKLLSLGARLIHPERLMRRAIIERRLHPQIKCNYIRVRDEGDVIRLSAKENASAGGTVSDQKETDVIVSDYEKTLDIVQQMGFPIDCYQESLRETWELNGAEITIDTWPGLLSYSEIEAESEAQVKKLAKKLGFDWDKKIITAAAELFADVYRLDMPIVLDKLQHITFKDNPFSGLSSHKISNSQ